MDERMDCVVNPCFEIPMHFNQCQMAGKLKKMPIDHFAISPSNLVCPHQPSRPRIQNGWIPKQYKYFDSNGEARDGQDTSEMTAKSQAHFYLFINDPLNESERTTKLGYHLL